MELSLYQNIFNSIQESLKTDEAAKASKDFHPDDISDLKSAIDSLGGKSQSKHIKHLKKELEDYEEDLKDLDQVKNLFRFGSKKW